MHIHSHPLERVLSSLGDAVTESNKILERARTTGDEDYFDGVCDDESNVVESLIGAAFVASQAHITGVVSSIIRLGVQAAKDDHPLTSSTGKREGILRIESSMIGSPAFSRIQVIDAMANFFKHHDEWTVPWSKLNKNQKPTATVVVAVGGTEGATGNLRKGLNALGIDADLLGELHNEVSTWAAAAIKRYEEELRTIGLI